MKVYVLESSKQKKKKKWKQDLIIIIYYNYDKKTYYANTCPNLLKKLVAVLAIFILMIEAKIKADFGTSTPIAKNLILLFEQRLYIYYSIYFGKIEPRFRL